MYVTHHTQMNSCVIEQNSRSLGMDPHLWYTLFSLCYYIFTVSQLFFLFLIEEIYSNLKFDIF